MVVFILLRLWGGPIRQEGRKGVGRRGGGSIYGRTIPPLKEKGQGEVKGDQFPALLRECVGWAH